MKTVQITKKLNNTELGKGGTHDTYILVPQTLDITDVFPEINKVYSFVDKQSKEEVLIRHTLGREKRIVGLGPYYVKNDLCACDEIIIEVQTLGEKVSRVIDCVKRDNLFVIQKYTAGFVVLTPERLGMMEGVLTEDEKPIQVEFITSKYVRQDSPEKTNFYDIKIDGQSILDNYSGKEIVELEICGKVAHINKFCAWTKTVIGTEEG